MLEKFERYHCAICGWLLVEEAFTYVLLLLLLLEEFGWAEFRVMPGSCRSIFIVCCSVL